METGLRFGCVARRPPESRAAWSERVHRIDEWGFDVLLVPDHLALPSPLAALVSAVDASDRLRFGTQVLNAQLWNPALLARDCATVDVLTDGRLEIGLDAGNALAEFRAAGLRYPSPQERVDRLAETVSLLRRLLAGEEVTSDGHYRLERSTVGLQTVQRPVPVMVGGNAMGCFGWPPATPTSSASWGSLRAPGRRTTASPTSPGRASGIGWHT